MEPSAEPNKIVPLPTVARLAGDSVLEFLLTAVLLFGVLTIVRWVIGPSPISRAFPQIHAELVIVGAIVGLLLAGLILSPPGRASGAHTNPAISLAMWGFGVFPGFIGLRWGTPSPSWLWIPLAKPGSISRMTSPTRIASHCEGSWHRSRG